MHIPKIPRCPEGYNAADPKNWIANVVRGAAWLDDNFPGWERKIDLSILDINVGDSCICGQVVPLEMVQAAGYNGYGVICCRDDGFDDNDILAHGFASHSAHGDHWVNLIKERFDSGNLSDNAA